MTMQYATTCLVTMSVDVVVHTRAVALNATMISAVKCAVKMRSVLRKTMVLDVLAMMAGKVTDFSAQLLPFHPVPISFPHSFWRFYSNIFSIEFICCHCKQNKKDNCGCDKNADCLPNYGFRKYECRCKIGFEGDGYK
jgi:hypothetical protein